MGGEIGAAVVWSMNLLGGGSRFFTKFQSMAGQHLPLGFARDRRRGREGGEGSRSRENIGP